MNDFEKLLAEFDYQVPEELIAQEPASPRDSAGLLVYNRSDKSIKFDTFLNLPQYLPKNAVLVFNETKVVPARLQVLKETGGKAEILYIDHDEKFIKVIADRKFTIGSKLRLTDQIQFHIHHQQENFYFLEPSFDIKQTKSILEKYGMVPLPPYIKHSPLSEREKKEKYQAVFARQGLSVAAPTASLHFTNRLMRKLRRQGIAIQFVTLNVNLGTFAPLREEQVKAGKLHRETYEIPLKTANFLNKAKADGRLIFAVGTTVVRTLESAARAGNGQLRPDKLNGETDLFIRPSYKFHIIDGMITNFHVPKSSLMMMVSALTGRQELLSIYQKAIGQKMKFFSFGDGMLIV